MDAALISASIFSYRRGGAGGRGLEQIGVTLLGLFLPATAQWRLDINGNGTLEDCGIDNCLGTFGQGTDIPIAGKWSSSGYDRIGVFDRAMRDGIWICERQRKFEQLQQGSMRQSVCLSGWDLPVTGDWSGDGVTKVGLYRPSTGQWFLDRNGDKSWDGCRRDLCISHSGLLKIFL